MICMNDLVCLIAAAGQGSRSGLKYPKTLFLIKKKSILSRTLDAIKILDSCPTIIVSPEGNQPIKDHIDALGFNAHVVEQQLPLGMGDAVLKMQSSPAYHHANHILLMWGDIPFLQKSTISKLIDTHFKNDNDFTFPTLWTESAYTLVQKENDNVIRVIETREDPDLTVGSGERDIGVFIFKKNLVFNMLKEDLDNKFSVVTKEHGFLYIIEHLISRGYKVEALNCASKMDSVSLNSIDDVSDYL